MVLTLSLLLFLIAAILFILVAVGVRSRHVELTALGLFFLTIAFVFGGK